MIKIIPFMTQEIKKRRADQEKSGRYFSISYITTEYRELEAKTVSFQLKSKIKRKRKDHWTMQNTEAVIIFGEEDGGRLILRAKAAGGFPAQKGLRGRTGFRFFGAAAEKSDGEGK